MPVFYEQINDDDDDDDLFITAGAIYRAGH